MKDTEVEEFTGMDFVLFGIGAVLLGVLLMIVCGIL
jgi:hypothetical protein